MLTIGSVCSGIGGLELGLERAGLGPVAWQIEIDPYARAVLARHWPEAVRHEDLRHVAAHPELVNDVDIICGGTPCQDFSSAGRRAGLDGDKSSLWFAMRDLVAAKRPRFVVWENVLGSLRRGMDRVVGDLCKLGYNVVGTQLSAADAGARHERGRVFVVAYLDREGKLQPRGGVATRGGWTGNGGEPQRVAPWPAEPTVARVAHGVPARVDRERCLGLSVVPAQAEVVGWLVRDFAEGRIAM